MGCPEAPRQIPRPLVKNPGLRDDALNGSFKLRYYCIFWKIDTREDPANAYRRTRHRLATKKRRPFRAAYTKNDAQLELNFQFQLKHAARNRRTLEVSIRAAGGCYGVQHLAEGRSNICIVVIRVSKTWMV